MLQPRLTMRGVTSAAREGVAVVKQRMGGWVACVNNTTSHRTMATA